MIVVNDGSTDGTETILQKYPQLHIISYPKNKGKGNALRLALRKAYSEGYTYAISIDSDGQHDPKEIPSFIEAHLKNPDTLIVGARKTIEGEVPGKNSFANKFSNFWFLVITGKKLDDTQSGYRLYPLKKLGKMKFITGKYEFELEILVKAIWKEIPVESIPIKAIYLPGNERITHFRPFRDFFRISLLNTLLVFLSFLYYRPLSFTRKLHPKNIRQFYYTLIKNKDSCTKIVLSVMLGVFMSIVPIWGYQLVSAIALAYVFRLNKLIVILFANISIPPMIPVILYLSHLTGGIVLGKNNLGFSFSNDLNYEFFKTNLTQYLVGSFIFAITAAILFGLITFALIKIFTKR